MVVTFITGAGYIDTSGGCAGNGACAHGGLGRVRLDVFENHFTGSGKAVYTQGFQPIIIPPSNQAVSLNIQSVGGVSVVPSPSGLLSTPDVIIPGQQANPISIVVRCINIPLNTPINVEVKPVGGPAIQATAPNNFGTQASSTAAVPITMPRGGGTIQAKAISGIASRSTSDEKIKSLVQTGWTADGERLSAVEVTAVLGGVSQMVYLGESGKRYFW